MRCTQMLLATMRETPAEAEIVSHRLMLRAGLVRSLASGLYTWLPLGMRVLRKVEAIVREEMNAAGAQEVLMPAIQPAELWEESGRWSNFGPELLRLKDRHERDFCVGPTHEEVITDIARREVRSYRQLPINLYQIQTKFRDEIRPRFGVMRAREFIMKDAYSFDLDAAGLERSYLAMHDAYCRTFERLGLDYRVVDADSGAIGGSRSQEFHVIADYGEDAIAFSAGGFAANVEMVPCPPPSNLARPEPGEALRTVDTPGVHSIADLAGLLGIPAQRCIKTLLVEGEDGGLVALVLRGDHELNAVKAARIEGVLAPLTFARPERVKEVIGCNPGSLGPVGADLPVIADASAAALADFACGANRDGEHLAGVNWGRDTTEPAVADLRNAVDGDPSPDGLRAAHHPPRHRGRAHLPARRQVQRSDGRRRPRRCGTRHPPGHGLLRIGVTRVAAAAIEQNHDEKGIIWPAAIAPFHAALLPMNMHKSARLREAAEKLYAELTGAGVEVHVRRSPGTARSDVLGLGADRHPASHRDRGPRPRRRHRGIPPPAGCREHRRRARRGRGPCPGAGALAAWRAMTSDRRLAGRRPGLNATGRDGRKPGRMVSPSRAEAIGSPASVSGPDRRFASLAAGSRERERCPTSWSSTTAGTGASRTWRAAWLAAWSGSPGCRRWCAPSPPSPRRARRSPPRSRTAALPTRRPATWNVAPDSRSAARPALET